METPPSSARGDIVPFPLARDEAMVDAMTLTFASVLAAIRSLA